MRPPSPSRVIADLAGCLRFFSRLPVPPLSAADAPAALPEMRRAAALVPLAGVVIALPGAVVAALAVAAGLPDFLAGALTVAALAATTGALHEDGLADSADGLYGGGSRERRLDIMRDSRIGSFGALALALTTLARAAAFAALAPAGPAAVAAAVLAAAAVGRAGMVGLWWALPPARADGLSAGAGRPGAAAAAVAAASGLVVAAAALAAAGPGRVVLGLCAAGLAVAAVGRIARAKIGGQTGDVLGAAELLGETAFLTGLLVGGNG